MRNGRNGRESNNGHAEHNGHERHLLRGILAGAGAGLAASWVMNTFVAGPGQKLQQSLQTREERANERVQQMQQEQSGRPKQDATMKAADALVSTATGGRHLSMEEQEKAGPVVHYGFGTLMGGLYGGLAEMAPATRRGFGMAFGGALFAGADLVAVPRLHLSAPLSDTQPKSLANPLAAHLVYGATTELLRRVLRAVL